MRLPIVACPLSVVYRLKPYRQKGDEFSNEQPYDESAKRTNVAALCLRALCSTCSLLYR